MRQVIKQFSLEWDRDYAPAHRTGWTVVIEGAVCSELEPWLVVALYKAFRDWRLRNRSLVADAAADARERAESQWNRT